MRDFFSSDDRGKRRHDVLYGVVIGALLVSLAWLTLPVLLAPGSSGHTAQGSLTGAPDRTGSSRATGGETAGTTSGRQDTPLSRCRQRYAAQQRPLGAAASAMDQWQVHIAAMNKLVLGVITLQQATNFWDQTRVGAHARLRAFAAAYAHLGRLTIRCPAPGAASAAGPLRRCERAVATDRRVLHLADAALATWRLHVMRMEMLRTGMMTPGQATRMWLRNWRQGQGEVARYRAAFQATRGLRC